MNENLINLLIMILTGFTLILVSLIMKQIRKSKAKICTQKTIATVIEVERFSSTFSSSPGPRFHPIFQYWANGEQITKRHPVGTNPPAFKQGQQVELMYNPNNPKQYIIVNSKTAKWVEFGFIMVGVFFILLGIGVYLLVNILQ